MVYSSSVNSVPACLWHSSAHLWPVTAVFTAHFWFLKQSGLFLESWRWSTAWLSHSEPVCFSGIWLGTVLHFWLLAEWVVVELQTQTHWWEVQVCLLKDWTNRSSVNINVNLFTALMSQQKAQRSCLLYCVVYVAAHGTLTAAQNCWFMSAGWNMLFQGCLTAVIPKINAPPWCFCPLSVLDTCSNLPVIGWCLLRGQCLVRWFVGFRSEKET